MRWAYICVAPGKKNSPPLLTSVMYFSDDIVAAMAVSTLAEFSCRTNQLNSPIGPATVDVTTTFRPVTSEYTPAMCAAQAPAPTHWPGAAAARTVAVRHATS